VILYYRAILAVCGLAHDTELISVGTRLPVPGLAAIDTIHFVYSIFD
ncbi:Hypothetical protein GSB_155280, partial [Giardia duodenalis]